MSFVCLYVRCHCVTIQNMANFGKFPLLYGMHNASSHPMPLVGKGGTDQPALLPSSFIQEDF